MSQLQKVLQPLIERIEYGISQQLEDVDLIQSFIPEFRRLLHLNDWLPSSYRQPNPERYQQFLLYRDPEDHFSIVSFVWDKGQTTPIHNHEVWGVVGVLQGEEISQRYQRNALGHFEITGEPDHLKVGEIDFFTPASGDVHQVSNALSDQVSISIHIYGADIGKVERYTFALDGTAKRFISGYSNQEH